MANGRRGLGTTVCVALGAAAVVFGLLPGSWPNPLPQGPVDSEGSVLRLWAAANAVDAACTRGDVGGFAAVVTEGHWRRLAERLAAVDRPLDDRALRELSVRPDLDYSEWLVRPLLAGEVRGALAAVAVQRPDGQGAQVLTFQWDGHVLRLDEARHRPAVRTPALARAEVADAVARRAR